MQGGEKLTSRFERLSVLLEVNSFYFHITLNQLVYISHNCGSLDVHQYKRRDDVPGKKTYFINLPG